MAEPHEQSHSPDAGHRPSPGARLRAARERKGLTLVEAADALRLDHGLLAALERDDFAALGAPVFAKGHLRKYAALTGEPVDDILLEYHQRVGVQAPPPLVDQARSAPAMDTPRSVPVAAILGVLLLAGAVGVWWWYEQPVERPIPIGGLGTPAGAVSAALIDDDATQAAQNADYATSAPPPSGDLAAQSAGASVESAGAVATPVGSSAGSAVLPPTASPAAESASSLSRREGIAAEAAPTAAPTRVTPAAHGSEHVLVLSFAGDSWVDVRDAGGARLYYGLGVAGSRRNVRGVPPFEIFLGRYLDVRIELDGQAQPIPPDSVRGNTARFTLAPT